MKRFLFILMAAVMLTGGTLTAFASEYPEALPPLPEVENAYFVVYKPTGTYINLFVIQANSASELNDIAVEFEPIYNASGTPTGNKSFQIRSEVPFKLYAYNWQDNFTWKHNSTATPEAGLHVYNSGGQLEFVYSNTDIKNPLTGEVVFPEPPIPLAEEIRGVAEEKLTVETMPELTKTVLVVALCGVGCLALAISLPLLKKVFFRFLA